jgi:predicted homoserine dehydrogenase-like protein
VCKPVADGGVLTRRGTVEVVSSLHRDRTPVPNHLQWGTYVVVAADHEYVRRCAAEYCMLPDEDCRHMALYRPIHMIGLEIGISVASVALRGEPTGAPLAFHADVAATAKRALKAGEILDGEGGYCVWGRQVPAAASLAAGHLPLGLASHVRLKRDIPEGGIVGWADVEYDANDPAVRVRREMEAAFARPNAA